MSRNYFFILLDLNDKVLIFFQIEIKFNQQELKSYGLFIYRNNFVINLKNNLFLAI